MSVECTVAVNFNGETYFKKVEYNTPLFLVLVDGGFIKHSNTVCNGRGICGKCLVHASGRLNNISAEEHSLIGDDMVLNGYRLACCCYVKGDCHITIPTYDTNTSASNAQKQYGFSVDLGSTHIIVSLQDILNKTELGIVKKDNPQLEISPFISRRIDHWRKSRSNAALLRDMLLSQLTDMMNSLLSPHDISEKDIKSIYVVGNTCMLHMLANIDPTPINSPDCSPCTTDNLFLTAKEAGLNAFKNASVSICGVISGSIGSDAVAAALVTGVYKSHLPVAIINFGAVTQVLMGNRNILLACDPLETPAAEGSVLACGSSPKPGVINKLWKEKYKVCYKTIDDLPPKAITASAAFEALEIMLDVGIIDKHGNMIDAADLKPSKLRMIGQVDGQQVFFIDKKHHIYITQQDVRYLQQLKASVLCSIEYLMEQFDITFSDELAAVYMCNSLGGSLGVRTAINIGMLPHITQNCCFGIGNASIQGASMLLQSPRARANAEHIRTYTRVLPPDEKYQKRFEAAMEFKKV